MMRKRAKYAGRKKQKTLDKLLKNGYNVYSNKKKAARDIKIYNDKFDYTEWRQTQPWYTDRSLEQINNEAAEFAREYEKTHKMPPYFHLDEKKTPSK
ncbi:MAG: hypothetical protein LBL87_07980 [Ruminococcus sp.]|jgi:hypothetical protein|nr:hypothetical protein [Ruminococcus sp.]